jgi:hypothetical protein
VVLHKHALECIGWYVEAISQTLSEQNQDTAELRHTQEVLILALVADYQPPEVL